MAPDLNLSVALDQTQAAPTGPAPSAAGADDVSLAPGLRVGRYVILQRLGAGGMGVVYAAYDPELDRKVAIKLLRDASPDVARERKARLLREAQAMARLSHPNVIRVYDVGVCAPHDQVFIAMEFLDGGTLSAWLAGGPRRSVEILDKFQQAGRGLLAAHQAGLVHRDFKPDNVLLDSQGRVLVTDFGLARDVTDAPAPPSQPPLAPGAAAQPPPDLLRRDLTAEGGLMGTPEYMAPEQFKGEPTDARTDQFSFCVALYRALYAAPPFPGDSLPLLVSAVTQGVRAPLPPGRTVATWLRLILQRGLEVHPDDRYPTMAELLAALSHNPRARRRRLMLGALLLAVPLLLVLGGRQYQRRTDAMCRGGSAQVAALFGPAGRDQLQQALLQTGLPYAADTYARVAAQLGDYLGRWAAMHEEACRRTHVLGDQSAALLDLRVGCLERRRVQVAALLAGLSRPSAAAVDGAIQAVEELPPIAACADTRELTALVPLPEAQAQRAQAQAVQRRLAELRASEVTGDFRARLTAMRALATEAERVGHAPTAAEVLYAVGEMEYKSGDSRAAEGSLHRAALLAVTGRHPRVAAGALAQLSGVLAGAKQAQTAERMADLAQAILDSSGGDDAVQALLWNMRSTHSIAQRRLDEALEYLQRALSLRQRVFGAEDAEVAGILSNMMVVYRRQGRFAEAAGVGQRVLRIREQTRGPLHPETGAALTTYAQVLRELGRYDEALVLLQRSIAIRERALGPDHPELATPKNGVARVLERQGRYAEALGMFEQVLALRRNLPAGDRKIVVAHANLGHILRRLGRPAEALVHDEAALSHVERERQPQAEDLARTLRGLAADHLALQRPRQALPLLQRALGLCQGAELSASESGEPPVLVCADAYASQAEALVQLQQPGAAACEAARKAQALRQRNPLADPLDVKDIAAFLSRRCKGP